MRLERIGPAAAVAVVLLAVFGWATPASATTGFSFPSRDYACTEVAGSRHGWWFVDSSIASAGTLTALSVSPASASVQSTPLGTPVDPQHRTYADFVDASGATSFTFTMKVHWDSRSDGGPLDVTITDTMKVSTCQTKPSATITSRCDGGLDVLLSNGRDNDVHDAGGAAHFSVTAAGGFSNTVLSINAGHSGTVMIPRDNAAWVSVTADGMATVTGGYHAAPGCYSYTAPPASGTGGGATGAGGGTSRPAASGQPGGAGLPAATPTASASVPADADPAPSTSGVAGTVEAVLAGATDASRAGAAAGSGGGPAAWTWGTLVVALVAGAGGLGAWRYRRARG